MQSLSLKILVAHFFALNNILWLAGVGNCLHAQDDSRQSTANGTILLAPAGGSDSENGINELVEMLRDSRFAVREQAAVELLSFGSVAVEALNEIPADWPRDARRQAALLLAEIENRVLTKQAREFLVDPDSNQSHGLPAWDVFRAIVGNSRCSKLLFLEMVKSEHTLLQHIEKLHQLRVAGDEGSQSISDLSVQISRLSSVLYPRIFRGTNTGVGESTALLLAVTMLDSTAPIEANQLLYSAVQLSFFGYLSKPGYRQCLQKLLALWVPKTHDEIAPDIMRIAFELDLPAVLPIARRHLDSAFDRYSRESAVFCIGKFGDVTDVAALLKMTSDTTIVHEFNESAQGIEETSATPPGLQGMPVVDTVRKVVRIGDLAAAAAMVLMKQDLKQYFPRFSREGFFSRSVAGLAVLEEDSELRSEAIKAWVQAQLAKTLES